MSYSDRFIDYTVGLSNVRTSVRWMYNAPTGKHLALKFSAEWLQVACQASVKRIQATCIHLALNFSAECLHGAFHTSAQRMQATCVHLTLTDTANQSVANVCRAVSTQA